MTGRHPHQHPPARPGPGAAGGDLRRYAWLSVAAAVATIAMKLTAWLLTGSVGLLADAAESVVNLVAAVVAVIALSVAMRPADPAHPFGHTKAEYLSAVLEGVMVLAAAGVILLTSVRRLLDLQPLENVGAGLGVSAAAAVLNGVVALVLLRVGRAHRSVTLTADGRHLLTDVWTTAGVVLGVLLVPLTGWLWLDPVVALLVGAVILRTGWLLVGESVGGLMDRAPGEDVQRRIHAVLAPYRIPGRVEVHAVRAREAGRRLFVSMHVLVPSVWTVDRGHDLCERLEADLRAELGDVEVATHLEPVEEVDCGSEPEAELGRP